MVCELTDRELFDGVLDRTASYQLGRSSSTLELRELKIEGLISRLGETSTLPLALAGLMTPLPPLPELLGSPTSPNTSPTSEKSTHLSFSVSFLFSNSVSFHYLRPSHLDTLTSYSLTFLFFTT